MSEIKGPDLLVLLTKGDVRSDLTIQFPGTDKTISGHKLLLSLKSPVFYEQFYGPLSAHARAGEDFSGRIEIIQENEFQFEAFNIFIRLIYGDVEILHKNTSLKLQLEIVQISKFYLTKGLEVRVTNMVNQLKVTMENLLTALNAVLAYLTLDGFGEIRKVLFRKVTTTFSLLTCMDQSKFYKKHHSESSPEVIVLMKLMSKFTPRPKKLSLLCSACREPEERCVHAARETKVPDVSAGEMVLPENLSVFALAPCKEQHKFYIQQRQEFPEAVNALIDLLSEHKSEPKPKLVCANCLKPEANCKHGKACNEEPRVGQWINRSGDVVVIEAVREAKRSDESDPEVWFGEDREWYGSEREWSEWVEENDYPVDGVVVSLKYAKSGVRSDVMLQDSEWRCGDYSYYCRT